MNEFWTNGLKKGSMLFLQVIWAEEKEYGDRSQRSFWRTQRPFSDSRDSYWWVRSVVQAAWKD